MTDRSCSYYQQPFPQEFVDYVMDKANLSQRDRDIVMLFRNQSMDTQGYADLSGMTKKKFCHVASRIHIRLMDVVLSLAVDGWKARCK